MPAERFFVEQELIDTVSITDQEFHHLAKVMRLREGDEIEIVNGRNQLAEGKIAQIGKDKAAVQLTKLSSAQPKTPLILAQAIPRMNRLEFILEKGTELNVTEFWLFPAIGSEKADFSENQQKRMKGLTVAALKQCGRLDLPQIHLKPPLKQWQPLQGQLLFGDTRPSAPHLSKAFKPGPTIVFIGPEKGFHPDEISLMESQLKAQGVRLHPNILRVDTASLVALSLISSTS